MNYYATSQEAIDGKPSTTIPRREILSCIRSDNFVCIDGGGIRRARHIIMHTNSGKLVKSRFYKVSIQN
jgi:hypothetical protein